METLPNLKPQASPKQSTLEDCHAAAPSCCRLALLWRGGRLCGRTHHAGRTQQRCLYQELGVWIAAAHPTGTSRCLPERCDSPSQHEPQPHASCRGRGANIPGAAGVDHLGVECCIVCVAPAYRRRGSVPLAGGVEKQASPRKVGEKYRDNRGAAARDHSRGLGWRRRGRRGGQSIVPTQGEERASEREEILIRLMLVAYHKLAGCVPKERG